MIDWFGIGLSATAIVVVLLVALREAHEQEYRRAQQATRPLAAPDAPSLTALDPRSEMCRIAAVTVGYAECQVPGCHNRAAWLQVRPDPRSISGSVFRRYVCDECEERRHRAYTDAQRRYAGSATVRSEEGAG